MKRRTIAFLVLGSILAAAVGWPLIRTIGRVESFLDRASEILESGTPNPAIVDIKLRGGESFQALLEHSCCSGAGFDAVALRSSDGTIYQSRNNYCGEEGFHAAISKAGVRTLGELEAFLLANGYAKTRQKPASPISPQDE